MEFKDRIKKLREERGWTQDDVAKRLDVTRATIAHYETGRKTPREDTLKKLADIFNVSIDYLLGNTDEKTKVVDLLEVMKRTRPHVDGVPISEDAAEIIIDILESYKQRKLKELGLDKDKPKRQSCE